MKKLNCPQCGTKLRWGKIVSFRSNKRVECANCGNTRQVERTMLFIHCFTFAYLAAILPFAIYLIMYNSYWALLVGFLSGGIVNICLLSIWYKRLKIGKLNPKTVVDD